MVERTCERRNCMFDWIRNKFHKRTPKLTIDDEVQEALAEMSTCRHDDVFRYKELATSIKTLEEAKASKKESGLSLKTIFGGLVGTLVPTCLIIFAEELRPLPSKAWSFVKTSNFFK